MSKAMIAVSALIVALLFLGGVSVVGIIQSIERVSSSGIIIQPTQPLIPPIIPPIIPPANPPPPNPSPSPTPDPAIELEAYRDNECTQPLSSILWGDIEVGGSIDSIIYLKNNGESGITLSATTENWNPVGLENHMSLIWNYDGSIIESGDVIEIILTLSVDSGVTGI